MSERSMLALPPELQPVHGLLTLIILIGMGKEIGDRFRAMSWEERVNAPLMELDPHLFYQGMTAALGLATGFLGDNTEFRRKLDDYFITMSSQMDLADAERFVVGLESIATICKMAEEQHAAAEAMTEALMKASKH